MIICHKGAWGFTVIRQEACREDLSPGRQAVIVTPPDSPTSGKINHNLFGPLPGELTGKEVK